MAERFTGAQARLLLCRAKTAALATIDRTSGGPYASVVNVATDTTGHPVIFISQLAWHTQNLLADSRASLLVSELPAAGDALTGSRATFMGRFIPIAAADMRERYAAWHPQARAYLDFADFSFWRLASETIHAIAGFGRIETLAPEEVFPPAGDGGL